MPFIHRALLGLALLAPLATTHAATDLPPTQLVCQPDEVHSFRVSRDAAGAPLQVSLSVSAGARECDFASTGPAVAQADGSWRFDWTDATLNQRQRVDVRRAGADGYRLAFTPAACGALQVPATATLAPTAAGCAVSVDRDGAFVQFWRQLRDALARGDGELLQRLSLPQLEFVEGPDIVKAPSSVMRRAARCLPDVTATTQRLDIRSMIAGNTPPRLDMPPLSRKGEGRIDFAGAMSLRWTPQGWRMDGFNASRDVFAKC
ncbi:MULTISPECIES: hypothetical protein [unclassified Roseateles]|uniref:hypothetical protein n=1 Tax=unclassified Roseateles TaxID=2626991 RepID=UPI0006FB841F|nr:MULTISPECIES: hypothetical protein [unclassified Roseateles]KQW49671.1 hypothetical protein ASC81_25600 [Pelomonas sp. Root405]KRA76130.1 hypothetical protein ASD88_25550 [Pelomonas sp. Root662]